MNARPLLDVADLHVRFATPDGHVNAVRGLDFELAAGESLGIVGESGSGKSQSVLALIGLLADNGQARGTAHFADRDLLGLTQHELTALRGAEIAMVFQDPMTALNPYLSIGAQMGLVLGRHEGLGAAAARMRCIEMLEAVKLSDAERRLGMYPHELSGGQRQRVMIAAALLCRPRLLIADEPTTALDVTVQAQILALISELRAELDTAILLITHDLGVVAGHCDRVLVMEQGRRRDYGTVDQIFHAPAHDYTRKLLAAVPRIDAPGRPGKLPAGDTLLRVEDLSVQFRLPPDKWPGRARQLTAVDHVSFDLAPGESLGVVGESGCGKSTLARAVLRLVPATLGTVSLLGRELLPLRGAALRAARRDLQVVFQDPLASLDPRMTVRDIVAEPLESFRPELGRDEITQRVARLLERVGLEPAHLNRYPHEFSGGQSQRIGIARALVCQPQLVICDEAVSALDVSVQSQIIDLLLDLQKELGLALVFIAHDLAVVRQISHRVLVMYLGRAVELATADSLYERPRHPYTRALLQAVPVPEPDVERTRQRQLLGGDVPSPLAPPTGCAFRTRCELAQSRCAAERPALREQHGSLVACHFAEEI
ncbi:MAG: ABC transporter ATP-binding protein [Chromatiales bacterium]|nr:MAG: ABC transporter ATP-binding protein [Chromatiales bacterium]